MPPMISSRPGARAMWISNPRSNSVRSDGSMCCGNCRSRAMWAARSVGDDESELMQQIVEDWFDERLELPICIADPGNIRFGVERRCDRAAGGRRYNHASLFSD